MKSKITLTGLILFIPALLAAQPVDPGYQHKVPDKVIEIGAPLFLFLAIVYAVVSIFRIYYENKIREKLIDKGISEETLKQMLSNGNKRFSIEALRWSLMIGFTGAGLIICHYIEFGFISFGIIFVCLSLALGIFYTVSKKNSA